MQTCEQILKTKLREKLTHDEEDVIKILLTKFKNVRHLMRFNEKKISSFFVLENFEDQNEDDVEVYKTVLFEVYDDLIQVKDNQMPFFNLLLENKLEEPIAKRLIKSCKSQAMFTVIS